MKRAVPKLQRRHPEPALGPRPDLREQRAAIPTGERRRLLLRAVDQQHALARGRREGGGDVRRDQTADQRRQPPNDRDDFGAAHVGRLLVRTAEAPDQDAARG